jgi:hypothetical protein
VSAWGGYVFIINLIPLHVFFLIIMGRFSEESSLLLFLYLHDLVLTINVPLILIVREGCFFIRAKQIIGDFEGAKTFLAPKFF